MSSKVLEGAISKILKNFFNKHNIMTVPMRFLGRQNNGESTYKTLNMKLQNTLKAGSNAQVVPRF